MDYIWGVLAGLAFGGLAGIIKYFALWHRTLNAPEDRGIKPSSVYTKMIISNAVQLIQRCGTGSAGGGVYTEKASAF